MIEPESFEKIKQERDYNHGKNLSEAVDRINRLLGMGYNEIVVGGWWAYVSLTDNTIPEKFVHLIGDIKVSYEKLGWVVAVRDGFFRRVLVFRPKKESPA